jgi:hypothetical protein
MSNLMDMFFSPLDKRSCLYFLIISVIFLITFFLVLGSEIMYMIKNYGKINFRILSTGVIVLFNIFIAYFVNRLLYTICTKTLN